MRSALHGTSAKGLLCGLLAASVAAQTQQHGSVSPAPSASSSPSPAIASVTSTTIANSASSAAPSPSDNALYIWGIGASLLSSYYPSTSVGNLATLTWPTVVVVQSHTYTVTPDSKTLQTGTTRTASVTNTALDQASSTASPTGHLTSSMSSQEKLGIGIGVAVSGIALVVLAVVMCCLCRRRRRTGAFFKRRPSPSVTDSDVESWRTPAGPRCTPRMSSNSPRQQWSEKAAPSSEITATPRPPPMAMHPAFARQQSHWSLRSDSSPENPFYTPEEYEMSGGNPEQHIDAAPLGYESAQSDFAPTEPELRDSYGHRRGRPPTPLMMPINTSPKVDYERHNPFASAKDHTDEEADLVSPMLPARSPERRHSPLVHYPSWTEVSSFDFTGNGQHRWQYETSQRRYSQKDEDGGDGWRPGRGDNVAGRHELA